MQLYDLLKQTQVRKFKNLRSLIVQNIAQRN